MELLTRWRYDAQGGMRPAITGQFVLYSDYLVEVGKLNKQIATLESQALTDAALLREGYAIVKEQDKSTKELKVLLAQARKEMDIEISQRKGL